MGFRIKTVAMLTGVSENTLRAWERRYSVVEPTRSDNGYRVYGEEDLTRLQAVKRFVDQGYSVREAVELVEEARASGGQQRRPRLAVLHGALAAQLAELPEQFELVWTGSRLDRLPEAPPPGGVDVAIVDLRALDRELADELVSLRHALGARQVLVLYQFTTHDVLQAILSTGAQPMRGPVRVDELRARVLELVALTEAEQRGRARAGEDEAAAEEEPWARARLLDDRQLARLAELASPIQCECPNHLAALISSMVAFERYSRECVTRSPDDAALHEELARGTARARAIVEELALELVRREGLAI